MPDLLAVIKAARTLREFVAMDKTAQLFAEIELAAAQHALVNARSATNCSAQVWTAIGHLESALQAVLVDLRAAHTTTGAAKFCFVPGYAVARVKAVARARYILCLTATCYWYLEESALYERAITLATSGDNIEGDDDGTVESMISSFLPLAVLVGLVQLPFVKHVEFFTLEDAQQVRAALATRPTP